MFHCGMYIMSPMRVLFVSLVCVIVASFVLCGYVFIVCLFVLLPIQLLFECVACRCTEMLVESFALCGYVFIVCLFVLLPI